MQQSLRTFDGTDPNYTTEDFFNTITANMVMTAGPEQNDSPYHEAWILKRFAMIQTVLRLLKNLSGTDISQPGSRVLRRPGSSLGSID